MKRHFSGNSVSSSPAKNAKTPGLSSPSFVSRAIFCALISLGLLYLIITHSIPFGLSSGLPEAALFFHRDYSPANVTIGDRTITEMLKERLVDADAKEKAEASKSKEDALSLGEIEDSLRKDILRRPLDAQAFRQLGQIYSLEGDPAKAQSFMEMATKLSLHEPSALSFLILQALNKGKYKTALYYADILMRSSVAGLEFAAPIVVRLMDFAPAREEIVKLLSKAPSWRGPVLATIPRAGIVDPKSPLLLMRALKKTANPPTQAEVGAYLTLLFSKKLYALAYAVWLEFLPPNQTEQVAHLFNGSFEQEPSGSPFDWDMAQGTDTRATIFAREDKEKERALYITFGQGRATFPRIRQTVVLAPGQYRFQGQYMGELRARRGLQWRLSCYGGQPVGESEMLVGNVPEWRPFSFDVSIPDQNCPAQLVELTHMARSPSEQLASGSMWFDNLSITRILDNTPSSQ
jgi:hypothetical protein